MTEYVGIVGAAIGMAVTALGGLVYLTKSIIPEAHRRGVEIMERQLDHCQKELDRIRETYEATLTRILAAIPAACRYQIPAK